MIFIEDKEDCKNRIAVMLEALTNDFDYDAEAVAMALLESLDEFVGDEFCCRLQAEAYQEFAAHFAMAAEVAEELAAEDEAPELKADEVVA
ncbi:hypothetical protein [Anatilimnocola floriformis]|uniref:hypothetical protein n=1 Tax=Anatilimnocola floriformis TaxID=2948575 RepID=UPI0020C24D40|nr:hypothetical protein [Anatilimnocola floriformis]